METFMSDPANPLRNFAFSAPNLYHGVSRSTAMDEPVPAVVMTKEGALALMDHTFETCDQSLFVPMMRATTDAEDAAVSGIMRGSGTKWTSSTRPCTCCASARLPPVGLAGLHRPGESDPNRQGCLTAPDH
jgi:hypothetical protein